MSAELRACIALLEPLEHTSTELDDIKDCREFVNLFDSLGMQILNKKPSDGQHLSRILLWCSHQPEWDEYLISRNEDPEEADNTEHEMRRWLKLYKSSANLLGKDEKKDISQTLIDNGFSEFPFDQLGIIPSNVRSALNSVKRRTGLVFEKFLLWVSHLDTVEQDVRSLVEPTLPLNGLARQTKEKDFSFRSFSIDIPGEPRSQTEPPEAIKLMINDGVGDFEFELHFEKWFPVEPRSVRMMNAMVLQAKKDADSLFKTLLDLTERRWGTYEPVLEWPRLLRSAARGWALVSVFLY